MAEEANWIMLPSWYLLKRCTTLNLADGRKGLANDKMIQVSEENMAKFWQDFKKHPLCARSKGQHMINEALLSFCLMTFQNQANGADVDAFRIVVKKMMVTKVVSAWLVLATQNFLDIQHIFKGDISRGSHQLQQTHGIIHLRLKEHIEELEKTLGEKG
jgi:hypothetical protein